MGINASVYSRPAKFSTIIADADLDIGAKAILTTNLSLYEIDPSFWVTKNRVRTANKGLIGDRIKGIDSVTTPLIIEHTVDTGVTLDGLLIKDDKIAELNGIGGVVIPKIVSDNLRNSHDAEIHDERAAGNTWLIQKTFTLATGIKGTLRFKLEAKGEDTDVANKVIWAKNSKADDLGVEFVPANVAYQANSQDVDVGTMAAGETIEIYTQTHNWMGIFVKDCRIYYDDELCTPETMAIT